MADLSPGMPRVTRLLSCTLLCCASPAVAQQWRWVTNNNSGDSVYIAIDRIRQVAPQTYETWIRLVYATVKDHVAETWAQEQFDCAKKASRHGMLVTRDASGNPITTTAPKFSDWYRAVPGSMGESELRHVCDLGKHQHSSSGGGHRTGELVAAWTDREGANPSLGADE